VLYDFNVGNIFKEVNEIIAYQENMQAVRFKVRIEAEMRKLEL